MKFTVALLNSAHVKALKVPEWHDTVTPEQHAKALRLADELGYSKVNVPEHFAIPKDHIELSGDHYPHAVTALAFIAGHTQRMRLSSGITILPLVHPIAQAKMWATLDWLSGGRAIMNVGVGWLADEFELMGVNFHERGAICDEQLQAITALWTQELASFEGKYFKFKDVGASPRPKKPIPIWFGGDADAVLRRVARFGDGWQPFLTPPDKLPQRMDFIRSQKDYHGRPITLSYSMHNLMLGEGHVIRDAPDAQGSWDAPRMLDVIGHLAELGVEETSIPAPPLRDYEHYLDWLRWGAAEVMNRA
jgi:probable F420-dependent oxidoreductase